MNKKADIWVSAVIYIAIGVTIITIILTAGLPVVNKIKDKNTILQTKDVMHKLDNTIREVYREGPGSRRTPLIEINKGEFTIDLDDNNRIEWEMKSKIMVSQPGDSPGDEGPTVEEGNLKTTTTTSNVEGQYITNLLLDYDGIFQLESDIQTLSGNYNLMITNHGGGRISIEEV